VTAEALMRSRFSAYATENLDYIRRTWHPTTLPEGLALDAGVRWYRLDVLRTVRGGFLDTEGMVEFRAYYRAAGGGGSQHELSRFVRENGDWLYLDGITT
jgi:SEC-C motif domain protein